MSSSEKLYDFAILGAEKQAATSVAMAYPERQFLFVTTKPVIDGWDLPNVGFHYQEKVGPLPKFVEELEQLLLCSSWYEVWLEGQKKRTAFLEETLDAFEQIAGDSAPEKVEGLRQQWTSSQEAVAENLADRISILQNIKLPVLPVFSEPQEQWKKWVAKGNEFHKPDAFAWGITGETDVPTDPYGCGLVYQEWKQVSRTVVVTGNYLSADHYSLGSFLIHRESIARQDLIVATESVNEPQLVEQTLLALGALKWDNFFHFTWIESDGEWFISSCRPTAKPFFQTFLNGGVDVLQLEGQNELPPVCKMIGDIHYTSYKPLVQ